MHGCILCFAENPKKYTMQNEDYLYERLSHKADYVSTMTLTPSEINEYAKDFADEMNMAYEDNCITIDKPDKYYELYTAEIFATIKDILNTCVSNKPKALQRIRDMFGEDVPDYYICYRDFVWNKYDFIEWYFKNKKEPMKLYLMEVYDYHA